MVAAIVTFAIARLSNGFQLNELVASLLCRDSTCAIVHRGFLILCVAAAAQTEESGYDNTMCSAAQSCNKATAVY